MEKKGIDTGWSKRETFNYDRNGRMEKKIDQKDEEGGVSDKTKKNIASLKRAVYLRS